MKECNYCGSLFSPKRKNQTFCNRECRISHNNSIALDFREKVKHVHEELANNYKKMDKILNGESSTTLTLDHFNKLGVSFRYFTGISAINNVTHYLLYDISVFRSGERELTIHKTK